jgi:hypothetical protein
MFSETGWTRFMIALMCVNAVIGWGVIEGLLWVISHFSIVWVG